MTNAILVVSFGTTHLDTLEQTIVPTEIALQDAFPEARLYRAFTSSIVRKRLANKYDIHIDGVEEAIRRIITDGAQSLLVQPTLMIPGEEYDKLCSTVFSTAGSLQVTVGKSLLYTEADLDEMLTILRNAYPTNADTALVLMGHGTSHSANNLYLRLAEKMRALPDCTMRLCTVEGTPSFDDVIHELLALPQRKAILAPMLFVAGDHAKNDMAGDDPHSLRSLLESNGFEIHCRILGLGQLPTIQQLFVQRAQQSL